MDKLAVERFIHVKNLYFLYKPKSLDFEIEAFWLKFYEEVRKLEQTLVIIKPDGVRRKLVGKIIQRFEERGLIIKKMQQKTLEQSLIREHYAHLKDKPFFDELVDYMTSGSAIVIILEQKNVIQIVRKMIGATNASEAEPGTIRGDFAIGTTENVVHASDSLESAEIEIRRFFSI